MADWVIADAKVVDVAEGGRPYLDTLELRLSKTARVLSGTVQYLYSTDEPTDGGYAPVGSPFPSAATLVSGEALADGIDPTFVFDHDSGDFTVEGCFLTDPADSNATVMSCEADDPFIVVAPGQVFIPHLKCRFKTYA